MRALIDHDFADRFTRILKETPAGQRAAAVARLREMKAASLASLNQTRFVKPSRNPNASRLLQALAVKHRAERAALALQIKAERRAPLNQFVQAGLMITAKLPASLPSARAAAARKRPGLMANTRHFGASWRASYPTF